MVANVWSGCLVGLKPILVAVEVDVQRGLPKFDIVGLAQGAIQESKNRVLAALQNSGFDVGPKKITVNLAPAHLKKDGSNLDLPIALGILQSMGVFAAGELTSILVFGELSLGGELKSAKGVLHMMELARVNGYHTLIVPEKNVAEASLLEDVKVLSPKTLGDVVAHLQRREFLPETRVNVAPVDAPSAGDWSEVMGQERAKRAFEIAASGQHNLLMLGPPGVGKTFMALRFAELLPELTHEEVLDRVKITSLKYERVSLEKRPALRAPHHSASLAGMLGGGKPFAPGELSLAHHGVLFMDEMTEFRRDVLEALRQPLEHGAFELIRAEGVFTLPADFILIGACNYCPCGGYGDRTKTCHCSPRVIQKHLAKLSAPIRDRFDLIVELTKPAWEDVWGQRPQGSTNEEVREKVVSARTRQSQRNGPLKWNGKLSGKNLRQVTSLTKEGERILSMASEKLALSIRATDKVLKVSRTLADMSGEKEITPEHLSEALQFRWSPKF